MTLSLGVLIMCGCVSALDLEQVIERAGRNSSEIEKLLDLAREKGYTDWTHFLLSSMPDVDLANLIADDFIAHMDALKKNRNRVPWADEIDDHLFYHYVLPHRVSQEPLESFASAYVDTLYELIADVDGMREAVFRVNEWVFTRVKYQPTSRWDQNALVTLRRGYGRCEELTGLSIKAMRTVGIPSRSVYTPWWPFTNSNHAWVEVWVDGDWHFIGGAEPSDLDRGWFAVSAGRTAIVKGVVYGDVEEDVEVVYKKEEGATVVNTTPNYAKTVELAVRATEEGLPAESVSISVSVYNYSSLAPIGWKVTGDDGMVTFVVGGSDLFLYASKDSSRGWAVWRPPDAERDTVLISMREKEFPDTSFWLYTKRAEETGSRAERKTNVDSLRLLQELNLSRINVIDSSFIALLTGRDRELIQILYNSKAGAKSLADFYAKLSDTLKGGFVHFLGALHAKDAVSLDTVGLAGELESVLRAGELAGRHVPDSIVQHYLLSDRILYEQLAWWREPIQSEFMELRRADVDVTVEEVLEWTENHIEESEERGYFGPMKNPKDVLAVARGTGVERLIFAAGVMRSVGIPARIKWDYEALEYWNREWIERSFEQGPDEKPPKAWIDLRFTDGDEDVTQKQRYYYDFSLTRFEEHPTRLDPPVDTTDGQRLVTLDEELTYCITGWRNAFGDTYVRLQKVLPAEDTNRIAVEVGIPAEARAGNLVIRQYSGLETDDLGLDPGRLEKGDVLVIVFDTDSEASISTLKNANEAINGFHGRVFYFASVPRIEVAERFLDEVGLDGGELFVVAEATLKKRWGIREMPSVIYLRDGSCLMWVEGLLLHLGDLIESMK